MSFDWRGFLHLAEELSRQAPTSADPEAWRRTAISRAYYAAFHVAAECAQQRGLRLGKGPEAHGDVIWHYKKATRTDTNRIGLDLERLRDNRNQADYDDSITGLEQKCSDALVNARRVIDRVQQICR